MPGASDPSAGGISPTILVNQVKNTIPFLFEREPVTASYLATLLATDAAVRGAQIDGIEWAPSHSEYFRLCLSAHWATVGSFVPTDVEHPIRFKLWNPGLAISELDSMVRVVIESLKWDFKPVSNRWVESKLSGEVIAAHQGEWFSVAVAAYAACRKRLPERAEEVLELIQFEMTRQAKVYLEFKRARDGVGLLQAATLIAHNLADLDRGIEAWALPATDALTDFAYKAGQDSGVRALRFSGALVEAVRLNRAYMATENHRHLALRTPRALRRSQDFLLPMAPFFDDWGARIARHPGLRAEEVAEIVEALTAGWEKLKGNEGALITYAYPRAVAGLLEAFPGGMAALCQLLPARVERNLKSGLFHSLCSVSRARFEEQWSQMALSFTK